MFKAIKIVPFTQDRSSTRPSISRFLYLKKRRTKILSYTKKLLLGVFRESLYWLKVQSGRQEEAPPPISELCWGGCVVLCCAVPKKDKQLAEIVSKKGKHPKAENKITITLNSHSKPFSRESRKYVSSISRDRVKFPEFSPPK